MWRTYFVSKKRTCMKERFIKGQETILLDPDRYLSGWGFLMHGVYLISNGWKLITVPAKKRSLDITRIKR